MLLVRTIAGAQRVIHACGQAIAAGVRPGLTLAHARALLATEPIVAPDDERRSDRALRALAVWAQRFSPLVASDPPAGLWLDITGCERVFHGERRLLNLLGNALEWRGFTTRVATAETFGCAWAVARYGVDPRSIVAAGDERITLTPLPVAALRIDPALEAALLEVGVTTIGHLLQLQRDELVTRFGSALLHRLDQALGDAPEAIDALRATEPIEATRCFDGPVSNLEGLQQTARDLLAALIPVLERRGAGVMRMTLTCDRSDLDPHTIEFALSRPSRSPRHLLAMLSPRIEGMPMGFGVERMTLAVPAIASVTHMQMSRWQNDATPALNEKPLGEFLDTVTSRLGPKAVVRAKPVASHLPERAFARVDGRTRPNGAGAVTPVERPSQLLRPPEPVVVMALTPDGPPLWLRWRGSDRVVVGSHGPERIEPEWWRGVTTPAVSARDYFKVQVDGGEWLWIYNEHRTRCWFVHGRWA
ncbi:MAG: DNA polymerase Y family protein [Phycisphaerales bacterium]|nr:DNA polymerase Y family protein [Phycisphaerales bacterium]